MQERRSVREIDLDDPERFIRRSWAAERAGWSAIGAFLLASLLGAFGPGPLCRTTRDADGGRLQVEYDRFPHFETEGELKVRVRVPPGRQDLELRVGEDYLRSVDVERIRPEPRRSAAGADGTRYTFAVDGGEGVCTVTFHLSFPEPGRVAGSIGVEGGPSVHVAQFVYP